MLQWVLVLIYVAIMFLFAGQETSSASFTSKILAKLLPELSGSQLRYYVLILRKTGHVLAYGLLMLLMYNACRKTKKTRRFAWLLAVIVALAVALADEMYQQRLIYRTGTLKDVAIDGIGIALASVIIWLRRIKKAKKSPESLKNIGDEGLG